jgi:hypothetical protein
LSSYRRHTRGNKIGLGPPWGDRFEGLAITLEEEGNTLLFVLIQVRLGDENLNATATHAFYLQIHSS